MIVTGHGRYFSCFNFSMLIKNEYDDVEPSSRGSQPRTWKEPAAQPPVGASPLPLTATAVPSYRCRLGDFPAQNLRLANSNIS